MSKVIYVCFTINNYTDDDILCCELLSEDNNVSYLVYGFEVGDNGTPHIQGYVEFTRRFTFDQIARMYLPRAHLEKRRKSATEASEYCMKEGNFIEFGTISNPNPGKRTDLEALHETLSSRASLEHVSDNHFAEFLRYERRIRTYRLLHSEPRSWVTEVHVHWGDTGMGKTRYVWDNNEHSKIYVHPGGPWFDGYDSHEIVLFDDYSGSCFPLPYFLKLMDRYPMRVPVKGGFVNFSPRKIFITSNLDPEQWYSKAHPEHIAAMFRRFTDVKHYRRILDIPPGIQGLYDLQ